MSAFLRRVRELSEDVESGAATTEFVIIFPIQLLLTLLVIQFAFLVHATLVVDQAAFMGARAVAVADGMSDQVTPDVLKAAATREVARTLLVLTNLNPPEVEGTPPTALPDTQLSWSSPNYTIDAARQSHAYSYLSEAPGGGGGGVKVTVNSDHVVCDVTYDYEMFIPVANHAFATMSFIFGSEGTYSGPSQARKRTVFRIQRVGFIPTPWTTAPR